MGDIDLKVIYTSENSNKFQKTGFWKEKSVGDLDEVTLWPTAQATLVDNGKCTIRKEHWKRKPFVIKYLALK